MIEITLKYFFPFYEDQKYGCSRAVRSTGMRVIEKDGRFKSFSDKSWNSNIPPHFNEMTIKETSVWQ